MAIVSRSERRKLQSMLAPSEPAEAAESQPFWTRETLSGFGVARVPGSLKWFAYRCGTDGNVRLLTPLHGGELKGENKPNAVARVKTALMLNLGGVGD